MEKNLIGKISDYLSKIGVAIVELSDTLSVGDSISIEGTATNVQQTVNSIQIEHESVGSAKKGSSVGLKVDNVVKRGDNVYKISE